METVPAHPRQFGFARNDLQGVHELESSWIQPLYRDTGGILPTVRPSDSTGAYRRKSRTDLLACDASCQRCFSDRACVRDFCRTLPLVLVFVARAGIIWPGSSLSSATAAADD